MAILIPITSCFVPFLTKFQCFDSPSAEEISQFWIACMIWATDGVTSGGDWLMSSEVDNWSDATMAGSIRTSDCRWGLEVGGWYSELSHDSTLWCNFRGDERADRKMSFLFTGELALPSKLVASSLFSDWFGVLDDWDCTSAASWLKQDFVGVLNLYLPHLDCFSWCWNTKKLQAMTIKPTAYNFEHACLLKLYKRTADTMLWNVEMAEPMLVAIGVASTDEFGRFLCVLGMQVVFLFSVSSLSAASCKKRCCKITLKSKINLREFTERPILLITTVHPRIRCTDAPRCACASIS